MVTRPRISISSPFLFTESASQFDFGADAVCALAIPAPRTTTQQRRVRMGNLHKFIVCDNLAYLGKRQEPSAAGARVRQSTQVARQRVRPLRTHTPERGSASISDLFPPDLLGARPTPRSMNTPRVGRYAHSTRWDFTSDLSDKRVRLTLAFQPRRHMIAPAAAGCKRLLDGVARATVPA